MVGNEERGKGFFRKLLSESSSRPTILGGDPHERGIRVPLGGLGRNRRPDIVKPNVRVRCTKCVLTLMTRLASRVIRGAPVPMIVIVKAPLVSQSIGLSCAGMPISSHGQALVIQALLIMQKTAR